MTLNLLGTGLNTVITLTDTGAINTVVVTGPDTYTEQTGDNPTKVRFTSDPAGTIVDVRVKGDRMKATVKTADVAAIVGSHTWTADVLGTPTRVTFDVTNDEGNPVVEKVLVSPAAGASAPEYSSDDDDDEYTSRAKVTFTKDGYTMTLVIKASRETESDDDSDDPDEADSVKLTVQLTGKDVQRFSGALSDIAGDHIWTGLSCDGVKVSVNYNVDGTTGAVSVGSLTVGTTVTPNPATTTEDGKTRVSIDGVGTVTIKVSQDDGVWKLTAKGNLKGACDDDDDDDDNGDQDDDDDDDDDDSRHEDDGGYHDSDSDD